MRYVVYGAGAIGGTIGGLLHRSGRDVTLIGRGEHLDAMRSGGLRLETPETAETLRVPVAGSPAEADVGPDDVVILAMKTQDTEAALVELAAAAGPRPAVVCAQNGVENERLALRRFRRVYGMLVVLPAEHLAPGIVRAYSAPVPGVLDLGRYPAGSGEPAARIAADLEAAGFRCPVRDDVMRFKYAKLLSNLGNALEVVCGDEQRAGQLDELIRAEGRACLDAAGIPYASDAEMAERGAAISVGRVGGEERRGGSSWQSAARRSGSVEADWLNGEIAMLGRVHGVPTPVNEALQLLANRVVREGLEPGTLAATELDEALRAAA